MEHERGMLACVPGLACQENCVSDGVHVADVMCCEMDRKSPEDIVQIEPAHYHTSWAAHKQVNVANPLIDEV
jgi:hypothetical protein